MARWVIERVLAGFRVLDETYAVGDITSFLTTNHSGSARGGRCDVKYEAWWAIGRARVCLGVGCDVKYPPKWVIRRKRAFSGV